MEVFVWISYGHSGVRLSPSQKVKTQEAIELGLCPNEILNLTRLERMLFTSFHMCVCILCIYECSLLLNDLK